MTTQNLEELWLDRDLTWLEFNRRVLAEALDERNSNRHVLPRSYRDLLGAYFRTSVVLDGPLSRLGRLASRGIFRMTQ